MYVPAMGKKQKQGDSSDYSGNFGYTMDRWKFVRHNVGDFIRKSESNSTNTKVSGYQFEELTFAFVENAFRDDSFTKLKAYFFE